MLTDESKKFLLRLARKTLENDLEGKESDIESIHDEVKNKGACFVTLKMNNEAKGSIGTLFEHQDLFLDVIENVKAAAFEDPRFPQLTKEDLKNLDIEISVITQLNEIKYKSEMDILSQIKKGVHGIIIKHGVRIGTLLPQEWSKVSDKVKFLELICQKAKLDKEAWKHKDTTLYTYETETFNEKSVSKI